MICNYHNLKINSKQKILLIVVIHITTIIHILNCCRIKLILILVLWREKTQYFKSCFLSSYLYLFSPRVLCSFIFMESNVIITPVDHFCKRKHKTLGWRAINVCVLKVCFLLLYKIWIMVVARRDHPTSKISKNIKENPIWVIMTKNLSWYFIYLRKKNQSIKFYSMYLLKVFC